MPVITYRYPAQGHSNDKKEKEKDGTMASIPQFCFPVIDKEPKSKMDKCACLWARSIFLTRLAREIFSFVLTESDGARRYAPPSRARKGPKPSRASTIASLLACPFPLALAPRSPRALATWIYSFVTLPLSSLLQHSVIKHRPDLP